MRYLPDFDSIDEATRDPLVIHRHGNAAGPTLLVLIHGLGGSRYGTWTPEAVAATKASLPKFLYEDIPGLDVGLYQYDTAVKRLTAPKAIELEEEAKTLSDRLRDQVQTSYGSLLLAGHSMGGILARAAVRELIQRNDAATLNAIRGLFLLATPQAGSQRVRSWFGMATPDTRALRPHGPLVTEIQQVFTDRVVGERDYVQPGKFFIPAFVVAADYDNWVDRFSAGLNVPSQRTWRVRTTHTGAVKPSHRDDDEYTWVRDRIRELVASPGATTADPFDACDLHGKLFINRTPLRHALRDMVAENGSTRVLGVKGPPRSGKTHSIYLIEHGERMGVFEKALVQLERKQSPVTMTPAELAQSILGLIGGDAERVGEPPGGVTEARWLARAADYIVGQIKAKDTPVLIVLDGFADPNLPTQTKQLIQEIVKRADREPQLRVVLLDYAEDLLAPDVAGRLATEPITSFTDDDLRSFFSAFAQNHKLPPPGATELNAIVAATIDGLPPDERSRNDRISTVVQLWVATVKASPGAAWTPDTAGALRAAGRMSAVAEPATDERHYDAAAVVTSFVLDPTKHTGAAASQLEADSVPVIIDGVQRRALTSEARKRTLRRLNTVAAIRAALPPAGDRPTDVVQQTIVQWLNGQPTPLSRQTAEELSATLQVIDWFAETELKHQLPSATSVRARVEWEALLQPLRTLAGPSFRGRAVELAALSAYVRSRPDDQAERTSPPLLIFGPGGMGKSTLLARFVLDHVNVIPFVYLDSDRPGLSAEEPLTLLAEAVRQLGLQFPELGASAELLRRRWLARVTDSYTARSQSERRTLGRTEALQEFGLFVREDLGLRDQTVLVVLDTFEEVQYRSAAAVEEVFEFIGEMQRQLPGMRTVVAGRNQARELGAEPMEIAELDDESAQSLLESFGVPSAAVRGKLARLLHGNPLSLRLAAEVVRGNQDALESIEQLSDDTQIQGVLYNRVLGHIHEDDVRTIAHPGLILRRITADIIQHVLAEPCGLGPVDRDRAAALWSQLEKELALVTRDGDVLRHRTDVRRVMLPALKKDRVDTVRLVHEAAVRYYTPFADPSLRAEELYHRLSLGERWEVIEERWLPGVETSLGGAVDELDDRARRQLATRLRIELADDNWESFEQPEWEAYVAKRVEDLLRLDRPLDAIRILRRRSTRLPGSPLHWLHSRALFRIGHRLEAFELAQQVIGAALGDDGWAEARRTSGMQWILDELLEWFVNPSRPAMPPPSAIRRRVQWFETLHPLRLIADRLFVGRERELAFLNAFTFDPGPDEGPLIVHGVGGSGKSALVAKFALDRLDAMALAFVDAALLDLPIFTEIDPVYRIVSEILRQLALQAPNEPPPDNPGDTELALAAIAALSGPGPTLLIIDNVDLLQYRTRPLVLDLLGAFARLRERMPGCRVVLVARSDLEGFPHRSLTVGGLDAEATHAYLAAEQIPPPFRDRIAQLAGGNALAMRLAAAVVKREGADALNQLSLSEGSIAASLLERIFSRIQDPRVRSLARGGLVLQRITPDIVRIVLAPAVGVDVGSEVASQELFELLSNEPALFTAAEEGIRPRGDVQRLVTSGLSREQPELVRRVHEAAVGYYSSRQYPGLQEETAARVQEIYHRLMAGQGAEEIDPRWMPHVDVGLRGFVDDLTGPARAYLAARLGLEMPEIDWSSVDQVTWERHAATRARDLIAIKRFSDAIEVVRQRSTRLSRSPLLALEAEALLGNGDTRSALEVARRGLTLWPDDPALPPLLAECERLLGAAASQPATASPGVTVTDAPARQLRQGVSIAQVVEAFVARMTASDVMFLARDLGVQAEIPRDLSPRDAAVTLVSIAERDGLLDTLVSAAAAAFDDSGDFGRFIEHATIRVDRSASDPVAAIRLGTSTLMFGRFALRDFLRGVLNDVPRFRVLLVDGAPGTGKSHTARLVDHVSRTTSRFRFVLQRYDSAGLPLPAIMLQLYELIGWRWEQPATEDLQSAQRTVAVFVDRVRARAEAEQQPLVLMFDVSANVEPSVRAFVDMLAANPGRLSIIVTGLAEEPLRAAGSPLMVEHLGDLSQEEVEDGMRQVARDLNLAPDAVTGWVRHTFATVPPGAGFNRGITREMQRLLSAAIEQAAEQRRR